MYIFSSINWQTYPFYTALLFFLVVAVMIQLIYILWIFSKIIVNKAKIAAPNAVFPPVSVIVSAHNELENLRELLPMLHEQDYPTYEVIIVNDRSTDGTEDFAQYEAKQFDKIEFIHVEKDFPHVTPKKYALTVAIRKAKYDIVLLTDADCRPTTDQWVREMATCFNEEKQIVLGYSPYEKLGGFLNWLIRIETFYVALQYLSFALAGKPYMGVGRNLMYHKNLFLQNKGFYTHLRVLGGDDDLLMNEIATDSNTTVCLNPDTFMISYPKTTWGAWFKQKKRHLAVSKYYKASNKRRLALLTGSHIMVWLLFSILVIWSSITKQWGFLAISTAIFGLRFFAQWIVLGIATTRLKNIVAWYAIPIIDFVLTLYYIIMGIVMWFNRKKKLKWK